MEGTYSLEIYVDFVDQDSGYDVRDSIKERFLDLHDSVDIRLII